MFAIIHSCHKLVPVWCNCAFIIINALMSGGLIVLVKIPPPISYRISYCTADKTQDKVFAYVSQSQFSETLECHAFLCQKKKIVSVQFCCIYLRVYLYLSSYMEYMLYDISRP